MAYRVMGRRWLVTAYSYPGEAFRWTEGGMVGLGDLPGGSFNSVAYGVSGHGSTVVGKSSVANGTEAFIWVET